MSEQGEIAASDLPRTLAEANARRGEQAIVIQGVAYNMRPTWEAVEAIEAQTGCALVELVLMASVAKLRGLHMAIIVTEFIRADLRHKGKGAEADAWSVQKVGSLLLAEDGGFFKVITNLIAFLRDVATGLYTAKGEAKAVPESPTEDIPAAN